MFYDFFNITDNGSGNIADWVKKKLNIPIVFTQYMDNQNDFLPSANNILPLTQHFYTILNETLIITKDMYGPLFNKEVAIYHRRKKITTAFLIIIFKLFLL